jgi:hypothetical protein
MPWMWGHGNPPPVNSNFVPQQQQVIFLFFYVPSNSQDLEHQNNGIPSQMQNHYPADYDYQNMPNPSWDYVYGT